MIKYLEDFFLIAGTGSFSAGNTIGEIRLPVIPFTAGSKVDD